MEFGKIERVSLPPMRVASYEGTSGEPEQAAIAFMENWLRKKGLTPGENGVRGFGFDCHKGRAIPKGCRIYHVYYAVPEWVTGDDEVRVKLFSGGEFVKMVVTDPFSGNFPQGWGMLLKWTFDNNIQNGLGCASPDDIYSLYSNEDTPCLEELHLSEGVQCMALYLPVAWGRTMGAKIV